MAKRLRGPLGLKLPNLKNTEFTGQNLAYLLWEYWELKTDRSQRKAEYNG